MAPYLENQPREGNKYEKKCQLDEKGSYNWKSTPIAENGTVKK
jgi:hypothetical protein